MLEAPGSPDVCSASPERPAGISQATQMCGLTWSPVKAHLLAWTVPGAFVYLWELVTFLLGLYRFGGFPFFVFAMKSWGSGLFYS